MFRAMAGSAKAPGAKIAAHLPTLYALAQEADGNIVECGVNNGNSTVALLAGLRARRRPDWLISIDHRFDCELAARATMGYGKEVKNLDLNNWKFVTGDSVGTAKVYRDRTFGLFFLDTDHTYLHTLEELEAWHPKMDPKAVICGHDYLPNPAWPDRGVAEAVEEFLRRHPNDYTLQVLPYDEGLFILWPK